jgi:N-acetylglucosamine kinase-like BadF-type ATPase
VKQNPTHPEYFLGVDTGATKTLALLADENGQVMSMAAGGPGNPHSIGGFMQFERVIRDLLGRICRTAGITPGAIRSAGLGLAGLDWPSEKDNFFNILKGIGLPDSMGLVNDAALGIFAGTSQGWGVCLSAGTSFNSRGRTSDGREGRAIGDGLYWGEGAGAEELVIKAARKIIDAWAMRGPQTRLTDFFMGYFKVSSPDALVEGIVRRRLHLAASMAPEIIHLAETGDNAAMGCVIWAAGKLARLAEGVINQLDLRDIPFEMVLAGSFFQAGDILISPLTNAIHALVPLAEVKRLDIPPVCGAILLAMEANGGDRTRFGEIRRNLTAHFHKN